MRKLLKILVLLSLCGIMLLCTACTPKWTKDAELINTDSTFELKFLENVKDKDLSHFEYIGGFGVSSYYNSRYNGRKFTDEIYVEYQVTAYPDFADGGDYVTGIYCSDPKVTFFGGYTITSGDELVQALQDADYKIEINNIKIDAKKNRIHIRYKQNVYVYIEFEVSNRKGIDF